MTMKREIGGRTFYTEHEIRAAFSDKKKIDEICSKYDMSSIVVQKRILEAIEAGTLRFHTVLGRDFADEIRDSIQKSESAATSGKKGNRKKNSEPDSLKIAAAKDKGRIRNNNAEESTYLSKAKTTHIEEQAKSINRKKNRIRKWVLLCLALTASVSFALYFIYEYQNRQLDETYQELASLKDSEPSGEESAEPFVIHYTNESGEDVSKQVTILDEYQTLYSQNKNLIGWIKIDDTIIDYPVLQCDDADFYLSHNFYDEPDRSGSIFMDPKCDVINRSTNLILYGHHMQSGRMFGSLEKYDKQSFYETHRYIDFDTIYEKGRYEIAFVFRSRVYNEEDVVFKYYQFIDAHSEMEFYSNMEEMRGMSLYDTGVNVVYGDQLLTLSTCDYQETNGRFVVVAKKIS